MKTALAFVLLASAAQAQDNIAVQGPLSDADFYRLVACAAPPDQPCQKPHVRWQVERPFRLWVAPLPQAYLGGKAKRAEAAITLAIKELNDSGAAISLARTDLKTVADYSSFSSIKRAASRSKARVSHGSTARALAEQQPACRQTSPKAKSSPPLL